MVVLFHSTRHNVAMTSDDVIYIFYGKRSVFRQGIYQSSAGADRTCRVLVTIMFIRGIFVAAFQILHVSRIDLLGQIGDLRCVSDYSTI